MRSYSIGEVSEMFDLPVTTIRYYDNEGFFPRLRRNGEYRLFTHREIKALHTSQCLKASGMMLKDIRDFMELCAEGPSTYEQRKQLLEDRRESVEEKLRQLQATLDFLKFECWYYEIAIKEENERRLQSMLPNKLPAEIQKLFDNGISYVSEKAFAAAYPSEIDQTIKFLREWFPDGKIPFL